MVATNTQPKTALANYERRWEIETLLAACKSRGLNLEDTHLVHPEPITELLAVLALAFAFAHATGQWRAKHRQIVIRTRTRRAQSIFRYGYDLLRKIFFLDTPRHAQSNCGAASSLEKLPNSRLTIQSCGHQIHERVVSCARYEKLARNYLATLSIAATRIWIRYFESTA